MPEEENQKILNTLAKGAGITFFGLMFSKAITYLYRLMIARIGPDAYGQFSQALAIVTIASVICGLSLGNGLEKYIPEFRTESNKAKIKGAIISALQMTTAISLLISTVLFIAAPYISSLLTESTNLTLYIRILSITPVFTRAYEIFMDTLTAYKRIEYKILSTHVFESIVQISVTFVLIVVGWGVTGAIVGYLTSTVLGMLLAFYFMEKKIGPILTDRTIDASPMRRELLNYSLPLLGVSVMSVAMGEMDTLFLGYFSTDRAVGLYNAAYPTALLLTIPGSAIGSLALTSFSEIRQKEGNSINKTIKSLARWGFAITFPSLLALALFSDEILTALFGAEYSSAGLAMTLLAISFAFGSSTGQIASFLKSESENSYIMKSQIVNFILNAGINIILIPRYGVTGAAIGTMISNIVFATLLLFHSNKIGDVMPWDLHMLKIIASSLTSIALVYATLKIIFQNVPALAVFPAGAAYFLIYVLLYIALGLKDEDWEMWYKILDRFNLLKLWKNTFS